ncbi:MAG: xanthine dehydrogenase molybdopterin binding subunit [Alphaproteobacteria bacterium]|nr:xanthine dehydrogenase molybdopterin binding subunit [Alphaproteobacteria bacterium]
MAEGVPMIGAALAHDSARRHVTGEALYVDDLPEPPGLLHTVLVLSTEAHAAITRIDVDAARALLGGDGAIVTAADIPGRNDVGPISGPEPILAEGVVEYVGQPVVAVAASSRRAARDAAARVRIAYDPREAVLDIAAAMAAGRFVCPPHTMRRGDAAAALARAPRRLAGMLRIGSQDHFYLEGQVALAIPQEGGAMLILASSQHPSEVQKMVARVLGVDQAAVTTEVRRMGGGFGGKETQPAIFAAIAAVIARRTRRPVKLRLDRDDDMMITGKRHDFEARWQAGFDDEGRLLAVEMDLAARAGHVADLSPAIVDRAMFHALNAYAVPDARVTGFACRTHTQSNTAFRGFGGPQGMLAAEAMIDAIARSLDADPVAIRRRNYVVPGRDATHYGQMVEDFVLPRITDELLATSDYAARRAAIDAANRRGGPTRRGLAFAPVMFGISFTATAYNQAGALVHVYTDGTVQLNHGGTEMGQGLFQKVAQIVAAAFGIDVARVRLTATNTGKVPNTSATAASSGTDLNGAAAADACRQIKERLAEFAARRHGGAPDAIRFEDGAIAGDGWSLPFAQLVTQAYGARVQLWAAGFYATPKIHYDRATATGRPFFYFACGAAVCEAEIDVATGESRILRADLLHDVGRSINPALDLGQVEGGFIQGLGWLTCEEIVFDRDGRLRTHAPSTYKIPTARDLPPDFRVRLLESSANAEATIHRSKAVGEPPLMLANAAWLAIKDAARAASARAEVELDAPATPEAILRAIRG